MADCQANYHQTSQSLFVAMSGTSIALSKWIGASKLPTTGETTSIALSSTTLELLLEAILGPNGLLAWTLNFLRGQYLPPAVPLSLSPVDTPGVAKQPVDAFKTNAESFAASHSALLHLLVDMAEAAAVDLLPSPESINDTGKLKATKIYRVQLHSHLPSVQTINTLRLDASVMLNTLLKHAVDQEENQLTMNTRVSASSSISSRAHSSTKTNSTDMSARFINPCITFRQTSNELSCSIEGFYTQTMCMTVYSFPVNVSGLSPVLLSKAAMKATRPLSVLLETPPVPVVSSSTEVPTTRLSPSPSTAGSRLRSSSVTTPLATLQLNMQWDDGVDTSGSNGLISWPSVNPDDTDNSQSSTAPLMMEDVCELFSFHSICCFRRQMPEFISTVIDTDLRITSFELRIGQCDGKLPLSPIFSQLMNQLLLTPSSSLSVLSGSFHFSLPVSTNLSLHLPKNACRLLPNDANHSLTLHWKIRNDEIKLDWECAYTGGIRESQNKVTSCEFNYHSKDDFLMVQYATSEARGNGSTRCVVFSNCVPQNIILSHEPVGPMSSATEHKAASSLPVPAKKPEPKKRRWNWLCCISTPETEIQTQRPDKTEALQTVPSEFNCIALGATQLRLMLHSLPNSVCRLFRLNPLLNPATKLGHSRLDRIYSVFLERVIPPRFVAPSTQMLLKGSRSPWPVKLDLSGAAFAQLHSKESSQPFNGNWACGDQGNIGACTAFAILAVCTYFWPSFSPSHLFQYYNERMLDGGLVTYDTGSSMAQAVRALKEYNVCHDVTWPYSCQMSVVGTKPTDACYKQALELAQSMQMSFEPVDIESTEQFEHILAGGALIVLGIVIYQSFESESVARTGLVPMPRFGETVMGGHAVCICGYDREKEVLKVKNSWGERWGDKGYFYLPYKYITQQHLATDAWKCTNPSIPIPDETTTDNTATSNV